MRGLRVHIFVCAGATQLLPELHWWQVNGSTAGKAVTCTCPQTIEQVV